MRTSDKELSWVGLDKVSKLERLGLSFDTVRHGRGGKWVVDSLSTLRPFVAHRARKTSSHAHPVLPGCGINWIYIYMYIYTHTRRYQGSLLGMTNWIRDRQLPSFWKSWPTSKPTLTSVSYRFHAFLTSFQFFPFFYINKIATVIFVAKGAAFRFFFGKQKSRGCILSNQL